MKFAEKENITLLEKDKSKITFCDLRYCFSPATLYPTGWFNEGHVYEITDLNGLDHDSKLSFSKLGMLTPKRIQFKAIPSHITAVTLFDAYFKCEFEFETSWYPYFDFGHLSLEQLVQEFMENCTVSVSSTTYNYYSEDSVECTIGLVRLLLLNFWLLTDDGDEPQA